MITPLDSWIQARISGKPGRLNRGLLERHQLSRLNQTLSWAAAKSPFYKKLLGGLSCLPLLNLADLAELPFTRPQDLSSNSLDFLCLSQNDFKRVVSLPTSGTTGTAKRIYFTPEDLANTVDFFSQGMSTFTGPSDRVLILMPGKIPGSVGDLLENALLSIKARPFQHGFAHDPMAALSRIKELRPQILVGTPIDVLALARLAAFNGLPKGVVKKVLLSADRSPFSLVEAIKQGLGCEVFEHYGMTEMGLGGAVECSAKKGCHLREADLFFEVVDPKTKKPLKPGETGEVVFTTLTRKGMPLIRYCTGDLAAFEPGPCSCGSRLKRLGKIKGRIESPIPFGQGKRLNPADLDEALFSLPGLLDATYLPGSGPEGHGLFITLYTLFEDDKNLIGYARQKLEALPSLASLLASGHMAFWELKVDKKSALNRTGGKRKANKSSG